MYVYIYIYIYICIAHYENVASASMTPVLREAICYVCFELRRLAASNYSKHAPRGVRGHLMKPCQNTAFPVICS